jgi:5'-3' exonuclease
MKYALIDTANTFFRARHVASRSADTWEKIGMAMHLTMASVNQVQRMFGIDHVVFCLEGRSWRKEFYTPYKAHRKLDESAMTEREVEENKMFWETYEAFTTYLREKTNTSVLRVPNAEADDIIARFVALHPDDEHFIISSDTDFVQLIAENVHQYNGVAGQLIKLDGYFNDRGKPIKDKKTGEHKLLEDPEYLLFKKIIRGDATDNVFSAYPGVREKGSKNSVGIRDAFEDREKQGFKWNNMMLQRWVDHNGDEHRVKDDYERNKTLIDLSAQPTDIREAVDTVIKNDVRTTSTPNVGIHLMKFCGKYELTKISEQGDTYSKWLNSTYKGILNAN